MEKLMKEYVIFRTAINQRGWIAESSQKPEYRGNFYTWMLELSLW